MVTNERGMPASPEAEKAILGAIILENDLAVDAMVKLPESHFYLDTHRKIYRAVCDLSDTGKPIDVYAIAEELSRRKELESVGGVAYLSTLTDGVPRRSSIDFYIRSVRDKAILRSIVHAGTGAVTRAVDASDPADEILGDLEAQLLELRAERAQRSEVHISGFIAESANRLHESEKRDLVGFTTGLGCIDNATTGVRPGELWIIGALPGRGKTAFGMQIATTNAALGNPTMFFSLEMSRDQLGDRILCAESHVPSFKIRKRWLNESEKRSIREAAGRSCEWSLYVDDSADLTDRELMARAKLAIRRYGVKLIVVDYLRLLKCPGRELRERVGEAANTLRKLAKQENVAVVGLSQLKRPENINDRPSMIDLKESGDIEAHAHTVLLLYQPQDGKGEFTREDEIIIGKQRNGPLGSEPVRFNKDLLQFEPREQNL
jgi:replicative DNA helicase